LDFNLQTIEKFITSGIWLTAEEAQTIYEISKHASKAVEIGCAYGGSTCLLLAGIGNGKLASIDPFVVDSMGSWSADELTCKSGVNKFITTYKLSTDWELINDYSYNVVKTWKAKIDLLFIDGDHNYDSVKADFNSWSKFINRGGTILIHDSQQPFNSDPAVFNNGWPGPTRLVREVLSQSKFKLHSICDSLTIISTL